ncbi:MAG: thiamine-phosphate kinase [Magnetococcus sp. DMHC-8]
MTSAGVAVTTETVAVMGEFSLIGRLLAAAVGSAAPGVVVGAGDDAAVVTVPRTQQLVVTTDTLVEGVHFTADADPVLLGRKALAVNLSDLAAMAAQPRWYLLSLSLPGETPVSWVDGLLSGLQQAARRPAGEVILIGGNTTSTAPGTISITITLLGLVGKDRAVTRGGAQVGDQLLVTGTIGDAALGLAIQQGKLTDMAPEDRSALLRRHQVPEPPVELAIALQESAFSRSAVDVSDGLIADLGHLCRASRVGAQVAAERVPLSVPVRQQVARHGLSLLARLLGGGEDYELLFTAAPTAVPGIMVLAEATGTQVTAIGVITAGSEVVVTHDGQPLAVTAAGWDHFGLIGPEPA